MLPPQLAAAIAAGATVVTPNKRLARFLAGQYDAAQRADGRAAWPSAQAVPWDAWLRSLWHEAMISSALADSRPTASPLQTMHLWERVVGADHPAMLDLRGAAAAAAEAWHLFHGWRDPGETVDGWARAGIADDAAAFARWSIRYRHELAERELADAATLPELLAAAAATAPDWRGRAIVVAGFIELAPQQRRLLDALADAGMVVSSAPPTKLDAVLSRVACATPGDELALALEWARTRALADPQATIAIALDDLADRRDEVLRLADDLLCPGLAQSPGSDVERPYGVSLGTPLASVPMVAAALDLLALAASSLAAATAAAVLRSPYLHGAEAAWMRRAGIERAWRRDGPRRVEFTDAVAMLATADPELGQRWRAVGTLPRGSRTPAQWALSWRETLAALGWPGDRPLGSSEWQVFDAWSRAIAEFATLDAIAPALTRDAALSALRGIAMRTIFQPERTPPRVQILGLLEASGMTFDALWIGGLTAERWPPAPQPDPLLPLAWQRAHGVPRCSAERELAYAQALTAGFAGSAHEVVASHGRVADGFERAASALTRTWVERSTDSFASPVGRTPAIASSAPSLIAVDDRAAPAIVPGSAVRGGAAVLESQSACPFQAFARHRLHVEAWPPASEGLTAAERGTLLHAAMAALWEEMRDHASLVAAETRALDTRIARAVAAAGAKIERRRWRSVPAPVAAAESQRLATTIRAWLDHCERGRRPFAVVGIEWRTRVELGGLLLELRLDRIDELGDGGVLVLDYKSGRANEPAEWFKERPAGTQVGLYALARIAYDPAAPVRAIAYAQLKAGEIDVKGLAADESVWSQLDLPQAVRGAGLAGWDDVEVRLRARLTALAVEFRTGEAAVAPRDGTACRVCDLQALCRIRRLGEPGAARVSADA